MVCSARHRTGGPYRRGLGLLTAAVAAALTLAMAASASAASSGGLFGDGVTMGTAGLAPAAFSGAFAWGANGRGQLGNGTTVASNVPVEVCAPGPQVPCPNGPFLSEVTAVSGGEAFSLALLSNGTVMAWGENGLDELGNGTTTTSDVPVPVSASERSHGRRCREATTAWPSFTTARLWPGVTTPSGSWALAPPPVAVYPWRWAD